MASFVLDPLFAGRVVRMMDVAAKNATSHRGALEVSEQSPTVTPLSTLPAEQVASLVDLVQRAGGTLEDSEAPFLGSRTFSW